MDLASCSGRRQRDSMVISNCRQPPPSAELMAFLRHQIGLSEGAMELGLRQSSLEQAPLPAVLWRYGLITLEQLDRVLAWQDTH
ncbi:MAG: DUF2949 domain-containing protein [Cyanobium sp.]|jgi:hypothetical protein